MKYHCLKKIAFSCLLIACLTISSCSDVLNKAPDGVILLDDVFQDDEKIAAYLNTCYRHIPGMGLLYYFWTRGPVVWCDEAWDVDAEAEPDLNTGWLYTGRVTAKEHQTNRDYKGDGDKGNVNFWVRYWEGIRECTVFLTRIKESPPTNGYAKERWIAEAHLLRAFYYSELLRWFGCP